jgi:hypothetical protein
MLPTLTAFWPRNLPRERYTSMESWNNHAVGKNDDGLRLAHIGPGCDGARHRLAGALGTSIRFSDATDR